MNTTYLIQLQPLSSFYFGSERNFKGGESYFARSLQFPQQTTLLGVLRYKLLEAHGLRDSQNFGKAIDGGKAAPLIGPNSFTAAQCGELKNYGIIKGLSHLFLMKDDEIFYPENMDHHYTFTKEGAAISITDRTRSFIPMLREYDAKKPKPACMISNKGSKIKSEEIFVEAAQVGILKTKRRFGENRGKSDDEKEKGFYKQVSYRFSGREWRFAYLACLEETGGQKLFDFVNKSDGRLTNIGGERSPFNFSIEKCDDRFLTIPTNNMYDAGSAIAKQVKAILLSDAYVENSIYEYCDFAVTDTVDFRFLETTVQYTQNYYRLAGDDSAVKKSLKKYNLLQRGSVLYITDGKLEEFKQAMKAPKAFRQIGYNSYVTVNSSVQLNSWIME